METSPCNVGHLLRGHFLGAPHPLQSPSPAFFPLCAFSGHLSGLPYTFIGFLCVSLGENRDLAASLAWHRAWHMLGAQEIMLKK